MPFYLGNILRFYPVYRFQDGGKMGPSSRESLTYEDVNGKRTHVLFYYDGQGNYSYVLPDNLSEAEASNLEDRVEEYGKAKGYKLERSS